MREASGSLFASFAFLPCEDTLKELSVRKRFLSDSKSAGNLLLHFQPPELRVISTRCYKSFRLRYFVIATKRTKTRSFGENPQNSKDNNEEKSQYSLGESE
jgi:hypothetical protein